MKGKKKQSGQIPFGIILILLVAVQAALIFVWHFKDMMGKEITGSKSRIDQAISSIEGLVPTFLDNEETMSDMYWYWLASRYMFIGDSIRDGQISDASALNDAMETVGITGAYLTDASGRIIFRAGEDPNTELPGISGLPFFIGFDKSGSIRIFQYPDDQNDPAESSKDIICSIGSSEDAEHYILSGRLYDDRYLTIQIPTEDFNQICQDTLDIRQQIQLLGFSASLNVLLLTDEKELADEYPYTYLYEGDFKKTSMEDGFCTYRKAEDPFFFFMGRELSVDNEEFVVIADVRRALFMMIINALQSAFIATFFLGMLAWLTHGLAAKKIKGGLRRNIAFFSCFSLTVVLLTTWFWSSLCDTTEDFYDMECLVANNNTAQEVYGEQQGLLNEWLDKQFLIQSRMAAGQCEEDIETLSREDLDAISGLLGIEYIYVLDRNGKTVITNSPNDEFMLSRSENAHSSEFLPLLAGGDHIVQSPVNDDSGTKRQYIGVGIRDKNGILNGCVLTTFTSSQRDLLTGLIEPSTTLKYGLIGGADESCIIDRTTGTVIESTNANMVGSDAGYLEIPKEVMEDSTVAESRTGDGIVLAGSELMTEEGETGDDLIVMAKKLIPDAYFMTVILPVAFFMLLSMACIILVGIWMDRYGKKAGPSPEKAVQDPEAGQNGTNDTESIVNSLESEELLQKRFEESHILSAHLKTNNKYLFDQRWKRDRKKTAEMSIPEIAVNSLRIFAMIFAVLFMLPLVFPLFGIDIIDGFSLNYVFRGNWNKGLNVFSVAEFLLVLALIVFLNIAIKEMLYQIAKISGTRIETICLLIKSTIKYVFAIGFIIFILSQIGISATAILASAGVLTMVIGLGAQSITADLISGMFLIFERTFDVGDAITIDGKTGIVTEIGLRTTKMIANGDTLIVNNSSVKSVINRSGDLSKISVVISIPNRSNIKEVEELLHANLPKMWHKIDGLVRVPKYKGISNLPPNQISLSFSLHTISYKRSEVRMAFLRQMKLLFDENGIEISGGTIISDDFGF
ncbi:MAG: mechanosensitive ion channel family protein [Lachnospiraceae bacterium]|nr:mechanosensitive ion channel family protein [Lachnospiraceae bacterium]